MNRIISRTGQAVVGNKMAFHKVSHVIFDMDGLILDTETLYTKATQNILDPYGEIYTWDFKLTLMGQQRECVSKKIVEKYNLPITWQEYSDLMFEQIELLMPNCHLLPDTEGVYESIVRDIAKSFSKPYPWDVRMKIMGTTEQLTAKIAIQELKLPCNVDDFRKQYCELGRQRLGNAPLLGGAERLLRHLHTNGIPIALATSSGDESVAIKTANYKELFSLFHHKVMGSSDPDVKEGKPAPDIFLVAASRFEEKPKAENCLVFEDAPNGVKAARAAGMQVVMVPDEHVTKEQHEGATVVLKSLEDLQPELFGLPPFQS